MSQLIRPVFGALMLYGVVATGWFFILALIGNAWWEKRQARLMRQQARGRPIPKRPAWGSFFQKWQGRFFLVAVVSMAVAVLVKTHKASAGHDEDSDPTPLATYVAHFQGKIPLSAPAIKNSAQMVITDLWDEPVLKARTLDLAVDTNLFENQNSTQTDHAGFNNRTP